MRRNFLTQSAIVSLLLSPSLALGSNGNLDDAPVSQQESPCSVSLSSRGSMWDISAKADAVMPVLVDVTKTGNCRFYGVIDLPSFNLSGKSGSVKAFISDRPGFSNQSSISLPLDNAGLQLFWKPDDSKISGIFEASVPMRIVNENDETVDTIFIDFSMAVDANLEISPRGTTGNSIDVDLGNISAGSSRSIVFDVSANSAFSVELLSLNNGFLKHSKADILVPYDHSLSWSGLRERSSGIFDYGEGSISLNLEVPQNGQLPAGSYTDELTVIFRSEM